MFARYGAAQISARAQGRCTQPSVDLPLRLLIRIGTWAKVARGAASPGWAGLVCSGKKVARMRAASYLQTRRST